METSTPNPIFNPSHSSTKTSAFYLPNIKDRSCPPNSYYQKTSHTSHTSNTSLSRQTTKCITNNSQINYNNQIDYNNQINYNYQINYNNQITSSKSFNFNICSTPPHSKFNSTHLQIKETAINKEYPSSNHRCLFENLKTITNISRTPFFHHSVSYSSRLFPPSLNFPSTSGNKEIKLQI